MRKECIVMGQKFIWTGLWLNYVNGITGSSSAADRTVLWFMVRMHVLCTTLQLFVLLCKGSRSFNSYVQKNPDHIKWKMIIIYSANLSAQL